MASMCCEKSSEEASEPSDCCNGNDSSSFVIRICAQEVIDFSSQYGGETRLSYSAVNLAGKANIYPNYGDFTQACVFRTYGPWWKRAPSAPKPYKRKLSSFHSEDYIVLTFEEHLYPVGVYIYETYNPGAVVKILGADSLSGTNVDTGKVRWVTLWSGSPVEIPHQARIFSPPLQKIDFPINTIRLELCHQLMDYYTELDCVVLCGTKQRLCTKENITYKSACSKMEKVYLQDQCSDVSDSLKVLNLNESKENSLRFFETLPAEVILLILSYLDILSLCTLARTCRLLRDHCYDHILYTELDLQPFWHLVCDSALLGLAKRCQHLQRLNLSWCGKAAPISNNCIGRFLLDSQTQLTSLQLSCCCFVNRETLTVLATHCKDLRELDLSCCEQVDGTSSLELIAFKKLERLNLYRTKIDLHSVVGIIRSCPELQHLNLGSCSRISNYTEVALELGKHCPKLKTLDLWRARHLTDEGLIYIADNCDLVEELDLGWCTELKSQSGCFVKVAEKCKHLKKLFLTANRTVCDLDILALAKHCSGLQQLDILGTGEVTTQAAEKLLENCRDLIIFDVSFCAGICDSVVQLWKKQNPHVSFKKSFQNS